MKGLLIGVCSILGARSEFGHSGAYADRHTAKTVHAELSQTTWGGPSSDDPVDESIGCCRGTNSACTTTSEATCDKNAKRKGCEWMWGTASSPPDCSDPTPEPGCCAGPDSKCYDYDDDASCAKMSRKYGCEWRSGKEADCTPTTAPPGCCYGSDSKCWEVDEYTCDKNARKAGCEWRLGDNGEMPDCTPPTPEPGCCSGAAADCQVTWLDQADCNKLARKAGCEWRSGKDADCTVTTPLPGCCYGESSKCEQGDQGNCEKMASRAGCEWRTDTADAPADCTPPTAAPGCCYGSGGSWSDTCIGSDEVMCAKLARKSGCGWITGSLCPDEPTTQSPDTTHGDITTGTTWGGPSSDSGDDNGEGCASNHRHRVSWQETSEANRQLYINGFKTLADQGVMREFTQCHLDSSEHSNHEFLPWHREFVYRLEEAIRGLGGEYECFTLPYWDWTMEPTPYDVKWNGEELYIMNSGLGGDGNGGCVDDPVWGSAAYTPNGGSCLTRDLDYPDESSVCTFYSASQMMEIIDYSSEYGTFRPMMEGTPHALPHVCIGGDAGSHMATYYSPDDPIFYLHHTFVDFIWAVWQDCNNYDGVDPESYSDEYASRTNYQLSYSPLSTSRPYPKVESTFDIVADYDVSYEMGAFWDNARVDSRDNCGAETDPTNGAWFYNTMTSLKAKVATNGDEAAITDDVFSSNPGRSYEENIAEVADEICAYREHGLDCSVDLTIGLTDCGSDEDALNLRDMLNQPGLSQCALDTRESLFAWAEMMEQKQYLCRGCYDPYCDADSRAAVDAMDCGIDSESHGGEDYRHLDWSAAAVLETAKSGLVENVNVVVMASAVLMLLAAKVCLDRGVSKSVKLMNQETTYGAV